MVGNDNTVRYKGHLLQLLPDNMRLHYAKTKVRVHEYPDGSLAVFHGPRRLDSVLLAEKGIMEEELPDAFIAFIPSSVRDESKGEANFPFPRSR